MISGVFLVVFFRNLVLGEKSEQNLEFQFGGFGGKIGRGIEKISPKEKLERWDIEEMRNLDQLANFDFCWL